LGQPVRRSSAIGNAAIALVMSRQSEILNPEFRIGRWSIDLAAPLRMLAIELDGEYWHSLPRMVERDTRKDADLTSRGWTVKRIAIVKADTPETLANKIVKALR
jgi:very-short-patch-repair endonuclease